MDGEEDAVGKRGGRWVFLSVRKRGGVRVSWACLFFREEEEGTLSTGTTSPGDFGGMRETREHPHGSRRQDETGRAP